MSLDTGAAGGSATRISVDVRRFPWIRRLAADYAYDFPAISSFYTGDPTDQAAWAGIIRRTQSHPRRRREIADVIAAQQERRGAPPEALSAAQALADTATVAIVTGQQAGLFGGPLFTLLKAITALQLAGKIQREHGVRAVPVFWIDGEDHDWEEVRSCTVFDEGLEPHTVSLPPRHHGSEPTPVARVALDAQVTAVIDQLFTILPVTEFRDTLFADLRRAYAPGLTMVDAFGRLLERVLGAQGLVVFNAADPAAKPLVRDVFTHELTAPGETARRATAAGADLVARGYHSQVQAHDDGLALFHLGAGRHAIRHHDGEFVVGERNVPARALVDEAAAYPANFSPNVLLRPIVQDTLFPTACYVAGPNELAYLGQLRNVYAHFGVPMPIMYPRASATLIDAGATRFLTKYNVRIEKLQAQDESALNELLKRQIPPEVEESLTAADAAIAQAMEQVIGVMPSLDPTLEGTARSTLTRMQHDLQTLRNKTIQAAKRRDETLRRQFMRTRALAFPHGHPQERTIGFVWFLNQYGPALIDRLRDELPLDPGHHWIVTV